MYYTCAGCFRYDLLLIRFFYIVLNSRPLSFRLPIEINVVMHQDTF